MWSQFPSRMSSHRGPWIVVVLVVAAFGAIACSRDSDVEVAANAADTLVEDLTANVSGGAGEAQPVTQPPLLHFEGRAAAINSTLRGVEVSLEDWETEVWIQFDCFDVFCGGTIEVGGIIPRVRFAAADVGYEWTWDEGRVPAASGRIFGCFSRVPHAISRSGTLHASAMDSHGPTEIQVDWSRTWTLPKTDRPEWSRCESSVQVTFQGGFARLSP